ncbi:Cpe/LpqF family protein [Arthrobacter sp. ATA002]|uniref:Cpe/LpqF family protein n=1 Tax=Arthrobacter sp. ATA002 TaxID=2991715 RepID=UPI0022A66567|nr:Cpe/LpqF family protein [Arthrobacter sp. ATA002]WAP52063.1 Cpe/LpqF family protein [Arthrobacter sp. ATA002]
MQAGHRRPRPDRTGRAPRRGRPRTRWERPGGPELAASLAAALMLALAACSGTSQSGVEAGPTGAAGTAASADTAPPASSALPLPGTPVGGQAQWILQQVNAQTTVDGDGFDARFAPVILQELSAEQLAEVLEQMRTQGPWTPTKVDAAAAQGIFTLSSSTGQPVDLQLSVDEAGMINGIFFGPATPDRVPAASWKELEAEVAAMPEGTGLSVFRVADGAAVVDIGSEAAKPLGSIFKLYVLTAVTDAVAADTLAWDTPLTVTDDLRSLPSGELQDVPAGSTVTVREAALKMISISDNTATDLLMDAVGRDAVEQALHDTGHSDPALNQPFLTTRELFSLGWGVEEAVREQWLEADGDARRAMLAGLPKGVLDIPAESVDTAVWTHGLDWFGTADDLMRVHLALQERAATEAGAPLRAILGTNNGLGLEVGGDWKYVAFKGGSAPGVMAGSWYLERSDGERFVVVQQGASRSPEDVANPAVFFGPAQDAVALLAAEGNQ